MMISRSLLLRREMFPKEVVEKIKNTHVVFNKFFSKIVSLSGNVGKIW